MQIHGFVSQGFFKTTDNNYLATNSEQGSFEFTEVGINFTTSLSDRLRLGIQLFAHDIGTIGNYTPHVDWAYLDYRFLDEFGLRVGRTKLPWGLYNESRDVDAGRVPILLPQSLYPLANREVLFAQTGAELYGSVRLGDAGSLEYRAYGGTIFLDTSDASDQLRNFDVPYLIGGRLMWQLPLEGLELGGSAQKLRLDFDVAPTPEELASYAEAGLLPEDFSGMIEARIPVWLWVASLQYQGEHLLLAAEYGRSYLDSDSNLLVPRTRSVAEGYYVMASYRVTPWFAPGVYYSEGYPNLNQLTGSYADYQRDLALTFRYDLHSNWLLKLEGHYMQGTAGLDPALNDDQALDTLSKNWGVLLLKTTAYF